MISMMGIRGGGLAKPNRKMDDKHGSVFAVIAVGDRRKMKDGTDSCRSHGCQIANGNTTRRFVTKQPIQPAGNF